MTTQPFTRGTDRPCTLARDGLVGVFVGGGYKWLLPAIAERLADDLRESAQKAREQVA